MNGLIRKFKKALFKNPNLKKTISNFENSKVNGISLKKHLGLKIMVINQNELFIKSKPKEGKWSHNAIITFYRGSEYVNISACMDKARLINHGDVSIKTIPSLIHDIMR